MANTKKDGGDTELSAWQYITCGLLSGTITKTATAPFERIRLLFQVQNMFNNNFSSCSQLPLVTTAKYRSIVQSILLICREEGFCALWKGNLANVLRASLVYALKFPTNDLAKNWLLIHNRKDQSHRTDGYSQRSSDNLSFPQLLLAASIAGTTQKTTSHPLDLLNVRIALGVNAAAMGGEPHRSLTTCVAKVWRAEGFTGFFKGYTPSIITGVPFVTLQLTFFEIYRRRILTMFGAQRYDTPKRSRQSIEASHQSQAPSLTRAAVPVGSGAAVPVGSGAAVPVGSVPVGSGAAVPAGSGAAVAMDDNRLAVWKFLVASSIAGSLSGMSAVAIVFPGDTIRKRMMANGLAGTSRMYSTWLDCLIKTVRNEGALGLYHGMKPTMLKTLPAGALQFGCYEACKFLFLNAKNE